VSSPIPDADRSVGTAFVDVGLSLFFIIVGGLAVHDSLRLGAGWGLDGPQSGYFPFLIGSALIVGALINAAQALRSRGADDVFVTFGQAQSVAVLLVPTLLYVIAIPFFGIYLASAVLAFGFLRFLGDMSWIASALIATAIAVVCFVLFDKWFLVSLPKGPIEALLGY
jgi:putative tricarboxylic transport membrane protein